MNDGENSSNVNSNLGSKYIIAVFFINYIKITLIIM